MSCIWCTKPAMPHVSVCVEHGIGNLQKFLKNRSPEERVRWARDWGDCNEATKAVARGVVEYDV